MRLKMLIVGLIFSSVSVAAEQLPANWKMVGAANLKVLWFSIYEAELFTPTGGYELKQRSVLLQLNYQRGISQRSLLDETENQLQRFSSKEQISRWLQRLERIWPDIREGDQLSFLLDEHGNGSFFFNQRWIGTLAEAEFSQAFISIWLSEKSNYPALARKLRGELNDEASR